MSPTLAPMTDEQRKAVALEHLKRLDRGDDIFEIRDGRIHRLFIYLDPDYADADTARYPWLAGR